MTAGVIVAASRRSRRRLMKLRSARSADMMLQAWLMVAVFARFALNCALAARELARGSAEVGRALAEFSMLHFVLLAFLLSFLSSMLSVGKAGLDRRRLALSGVRVGQLLPAELAVLVSWPMTAVIAIFLVPAAVPLLHLARPGAALAGLLLAFISALLAGAGLSALLGLSSMARRISGVFRYAFVAALIGLVAINFDFDWTGSTVRLFVFQHPVLLVNDAGSGLLSALRPWGPWSWIVEARPLACALTAAASFLFYCIVTAAAFGRSGIINPSTAPRWQKDRAPRPSAGPGLFRQELRHLILSGTGITDAAVGIGFTAWLLLTAHQTPGIPLLGGFFILLAGFSRAVNLFGNDGGAVRRFVFGGIQWERLFLARNVAWLTVSGAASVPLLAAAAVRLRIPAASSLALAIAFALVLTVAWGNISSLLFASPRRAHHAAAQESPPFVNQAAPLAIGGVVLGVHQLVAPFGSAGFDTAIAACCAASAVFGVLYLRRVARGFDDELEPLLEKLRT